MYRSDEGSFRGGGSSYLAPVEVGKEYDVEIEDIAKEGDGIARIEGFVVFVPDTKVGDQVKINVDKVMRRFAMGHKV
ncbi:MAG: TRAM domain-containing protein [Euryarchaeota archaeon]|nr:TRAM domain-containing protein [Euryarchaeota archaeon]